MVVRLFTEEATFIVGAAVCNNNNNDDEDDNDDGDEEDNNNDNDDEDHKDDKYDCCWSEYKAELSDDAMSHIKHEETTHQYHDKINTWIF